MKTTTLELVQFRLVSGKNDADLQATQTSIEDFLNEQQGFIYRSLSAKDDGTYIDIVYWESMEDAKNASDALMQDERGLAMIALCDMDSVSMQHMPVISESMSAKLDSVA